jgi:RNA polymerase sigma-70 factor (ECF subfamily)
MSPSSEHSLIDRCRKGEETAFRELVDQYKGLVFGLISRSVTDRAEAEDLAQDVFLRIHRGLPYFRGESKLTTWIYRIVINLLSQRRPALATISLDQDNERDGPRLDPGGPDRSFGDLVLRDRLDRAIQQLPVPYQVLINGHYLKDMKYEDLADALGLPMGTVKTHLHRAKKRLRRILEAETA